MKIIVVGGGKLTYFLAKHFVAVGHQLAIINRDPEEARLLARSVDAAVFLGDGSDPIILSEAEAAQADVVLALTTHDPDNLVACQISQHYFGVSRTIALVNDPNYQRVFEQLGISVAFSATQLLASVIEQQTDFFNIQSLFPVAEGQVTVTEIVLDETSPALDQPIQSLALPAGGLIGCIIRQGKLIVPKGAYRLRQKDRLVLIVQPEQADKMLAAFVKEAHT